MEEILIKLKKELKDPDLRNAFVSSIAMAYIDADENYKRKNNKQGKYINNRDRHIISNNAANHFIDLLLK